MINGVTYNIGYAYNAAGELNSLTYPSGRVVSPGYDAIGRMTQIASGGTNYLSGMAYNSAQLPTGFNYGNGVQASFGYNDRLQIASLAYTSGSNTLLNLTYNYGTGNNGQIQGITDSRGAAFSVSYAYDGIGRLSQAQTNDLTSANTWKLAWNYDRYGNRLSQTLVGGTMTVGQPQLTVDANTNHINTSGFNYDASGNLTKDTSHNYIYNAEGEITQVDATSSYAYDGHRWRIQKTVNGAATVYIYSGSKVIAEYPSGGAASTPNVEYIYSGSNLLATIAGTSVIYHHRDHLSNRVETTSSGAVTRTFAPLPFGDSGFETGTADKWKFTSYERDAESGLDYAMNRFYSSGFGRFMSPDLLSGRTASPQSLNRYAYVLNDPVNLTDPLGLLGHCTLGGIYPNCLEDAGEGSGPGDPGAPLPLTFRPGGGGGRIADLKKAVYDKFQKKLNDCIKQVFGKDANRIPEQIPANAPIVNAKLSSDQIADQWNLNLSGDRMVAGENKPKRGANGTIYMASDVLASATNPNFFAGTFTHELGNILDAKLNPNGGNGRGYEDTYGNPNDPWDKDTGMALERCIFGGQPQLPWKE